MADEPKPRSASASFASAARLGAKAARLAARFKAEKGAREAAERERDALRARPTPDDVVKERDALRAEKRAGVHRKAFDKVAGELKVRPEALDDLWELSRLDTAGDAPDEAGIREAIGPKVAARPYLVAGDEATPPAARKLDPGPGGDRGGRTDLVGKFSVTRSQLCDGDWMQANQDKLHEATAQGRVAFVD